MLLQRKKLEELTIKVGSGVTPRGGEKVYQPSGTALIRSQNVYDYHFQEDGLVFINEEEATRMRGVTVLPNDILLNITGDSVGRSCLVSNKVLPARVNQHVCIVRTIEDELDPVYASYYLNEPTNKGRLLNHAHGGTRKALTKGIIESFEVSYPEITIQRRIANILSSLDDKVELNRRMNETLEQIAMVLYKHWFVDFGPFQDGEFEESDLGMIPKGWKVKSLYSLANYINGMAFKQSTLNEDGNGLPVIKITELNADSPKGAKYYEGEYQDKYFLYTGDVLFSWSASLGIYLWSYGPALLNQHIFNIKSNGSLSRKMLYFLLKYVVHEFKEIAAGRATTMGHITKEHLVAKLIPYPSPDQLSEIESKFEGLFDMILANLIERKTLIETRDYLLPRLLSGDIKVQAAEEKIEEVLSHA